ncbi:hypothetical protein AKO1_007853 [Acrasis kona]|uniref:E3 ubiquitin-protein ligase CHFR n=1 Tax=Acrasis kona TaxID=1008807 RepID=A0AAW2YPW5_9EUKA
MSAGVGADSLEHNDNSSTSTNIESQNAPQLDQSQEKIGQPHMYAKLCLLTDTKGVPKEVDIKTLQFSIGRAKNQVDLLLDPAEHSRMVSRVHCTIYGVPGEDGKISFRISDNKSVNGTFLNAKKIETSRLENGDLLLFTAGSGLQVGDFMDFSTDNPSTPFDKLTEQQKQDILSKRKDTFVYKFVVVDDNFDRMVDDLTNHSFQNHSSSTPGSKRKLEQMDSSYSDFAQELKKRKTAEDALNQRIMDLEKQLEEAKNQLTKEQSQLQELITETQKANEGLVREHESRVNELLATINQLNQQQQAQQQAQAQQLQDAQEHGIMGDIEQEFTCAICQELIVSATTLQCSHTFCKPCLAEWIKQKKVCPVCRKILTKPPTRNLTMENVLDKLMKNLSKEEQESRLRRRKDLIEAEERASQKLKELVETARHKGVKFLNVHDTWGPDEKKLFKTGVSKHEGRSRLMYCELTGFNPEWIRRATVQQIIRACTNLDIEIPKKVESRQTVMDFELARERLLDYLEGDLVRFV